MTAPSLRDRIAAAIEAVCHEPGSGTPCDLCLETADAVLAVLADADPTDLGFKPVDGITYCTFHDATAERARAGACDRAHHFCAEVPVYARPTDIGGRTLTTIQMLEQERDAMQRRTFELAEQIAAARAELPEVLDLLRAVVERCVPAVLDAPDRPIDDLWGLVWRRLGNAHPRTEEAHTVDVGHVHVLAEPGGPCAPGCPHPDHRTEEA